MWLIDGLYEIFQTLKIILDIYVYVHLPWESIVLNRIWQRVYDAQKLKDYCLIVISGTHCLPILPTSQKWLYSWPVAHFSFLCVS